MKHFLLFLAVFTLSLLLVGVLPHLIRAQILSVKPSGFPPANPTVLAPAATISIESASAAVNSGPGIPQAGAYGEGLAIDYQVLKDFPALDMFASKVATGSSSELVGVYAPGLFALPVLQQPSGRPEFVSSDNNVVTQFGLPRRYGSIGLLAHNYLSGSEFLDLGVGQEVVLVYGDGRQVRYRIEFISQYQALDPTNPFSQFIDVNDPAHGVLSSADLFNRIYTAPGQLTFQTCVEAFGDPSWGRIFITALPVDPAQVGMPFLGQFVGSN